MGLISSPYRWLTNAGDGAGANMQSKVGGGDGYSFWRISDDSSAAQVNDGDSAIWTGSNGIGTSLTSRTMTINGGVWATAGSGSLLRSTATGVVSKLEQGTDNYVLTVDTAVEGGMAWEPPQPSPLANTYVGYGSAGNVITGESVFNYNAGLNTMSVPTVSCSTMLTAATITDGTATMAGDVLTAGTITDGTATMTGDIVTAGTITDGTATLTSDTLTAGTITDGTATLTGGDLTAVNSTTDGGIISKVNTPSKNTSYVFDTGALDYHVHMINDTNGINPGISITGTLPVPVAGREILVSTNVAINVINNNTIEILVADPSHTINEVLTTFTINDNGNNNYNIVMFRALSDTAWVVAKMEAVS